MSNRIVSPLCLVTLKPSDEPQSAPTSEITLFSLCFQANKLAAKRKAHDDAEKTKKKKTKK